MKKKRYSEYTALAAAGLVFIAFLAGSLFFVYHERSRNETQSIGYLQDATSQSKASVLQKLEGDLQILRGVSISISKMNLTDTQRVEAILADVNRSNSFVQMGLSDLDGSTTMVGDGGDVELAELPALATALGGREGFSKTLWSDELDRYVNYYAVPVRQNDYLVGALMAVNDGQVLYELLNTPVFQGQGYVTILDAVGDIVSLPTSPDPTVVLGANLFEVADFTDEAEAAARAALAGGHALNTRLRLDGLEELVCLEPLGVNGWFIMSTVPYAEINTYYNRTAVGTALIILAASVVFLFLMLRQLFQARRSRGALEKIAYTDPLTGYRNYPKFLLDAEELLRKQKTVRYAVWSYDIKKFNTVNDIFGSAVGDRLLVRVAKEIEARQGPNATFCRVAADNFVGLRPYENREQVQQWFHALYAALSVREVVAENQMHIDNAMGVYCVDEFEERPPVDDMVNSAAIARKAAKQQAGTGLQFFTPAMGEHLRRDAELEVGGLAALERGEIIFYLQPKVAIQGGAFRVTGAEALARWQHPRRGFVSPDEFIPLFEKNGFVVELDRYIFEQVCAWYAQQPQQQPVVQLSINVSRQGLQRDDFVQFYSTVKNHYRVPNGVLELEFTESVIFEDYEMFHNTVLVLQHHGFKCSIDDFGSGYSSLNVLKNLPIDVLKLDAVFFRDSTDPHREEVVVSSFLAMAHELGIVTVAEGVETESQVNFLRRAGCDIVQGYVFSKPLPPQQFAHLTQRDGGIMQL